MGSWSEIWRYLSNFDQFWRHRSPFVYLFSHSVLKVSSDVTPRDCQFRLCCLIISHCEWCYFTKQYNKSMKIDVMITAPLVGNEEIPEILFFYIQTFVIHSFFYEQTVYLILYQRGILLKSKFPPPLPWRKSPCTLQSIMTWTFLECSLG